MTLVVQGGRRPLEVGSLADEGSVLRGRGRQRLLQRAELYPARLRVLAQALLDARHLAIVPGDGGSGPLGDIGREQDLVEHVERGQTRCGTGRLSVHAGGCGDAPGSGELARLLGGAVEQGELAGEAGVPGGDVGVGTSRLTQPHLEVVHAGAQLGHPVAQPRPPPLQLGRPPRVLGVGARDGRDPPVEVGDEGRRLVDVVQLALRRGDPRGGPRGVGAGRHLLRGGEVAHEPVAHGTRREGVGRGDLRGSQRRRDLRGRDGVGGHGRRRVLGGAAHGARGAVREGAGQLGGHPGQAALDQVEVPGARAVGCVVGGAHVVVRRPRRRRERDHADDGGPHGACPLEGAARVVGAAGDPRRDLPPRVGVVAFVGERDPLRGQRGQLLLHPGVLGLGADELAHAVGLLRLGREEGGQRTDLGAHGVGAPGEHLRVA